MLAIKSTKTKMSFTCDAALLLNSVSRIITVTDYGQVSADKKQHFLATHDGKLYLIGMTQDVFAYIVIEAETHVDGICMLDAAALLGLLKKRKGLFDFDSTGSDLVFVAQESKYKGKITLSTIDDDTLAAINSIDSTKSAVKLKPETLVELKRAIKSTASKSIVFGLPLTSHIVVEDSTLTACVKDEYHAIVYYGKEKLDSNDFDLAVTGSAYNVIEKFIANEVVSFNIDSCIKIYKKGVIYASIPSVQEDATGLREVLDGAKSVEKSKKLVSVSMPSSVNEIMANMLSLKSAQLEASSKFDFVLTGKELKISYKTSSGQVSDTIAVKTLTDGKEKFSIPEKLVTSVFGAFAGHEDVAFTIYQNNFILSLDTEAYSLKGLGTYDKEK